MPKTGHHSKLPKRGDGLSKIPAGGASLVGLLAAVFALKLTVVWQLKNHILLQPDAGLDTSVYLTLASRVVGGDLALGPGLYFVSPLYIYFAALILAISKSLTWLRVVQIMFGTASVGLVWWTTREWAGRRAAWIAAVVAGLTGLFTFYETLLLQAALDPFLSALCIALLCGALTRTRSGWFVVTGAAFGVHSLNRPNMAIAALGLIALLFLTQRWRGSALMGLGLCIAVAPVSVRNAVIARDWSPVASHGGLNFYIGNNPDADGTYSRVAGITPSITGQQEDARRVAEAAAGHSLTDGQVSTYFYRRAAEWIRTQPFAAMRLFVRKLWYTFHASHLSLNYSYPFYAYDAGTFLRFMFFGPSLLIPLGLSGLAWTAWRHRSPGFVIWVAFVPFYAISVAMFFVSERYRLPLLVPLCIGTGTTLDAVFAAIAAKRQRSALALLGAAAIVAIPSNWPLHLDDGRAEERTRMAERSAQQQHFVEAEFWAALAEQIHPTPGILHFRVGRALLTAGQREPGLQHLEASLRIDPEQPEVHFALGQALLDSARGAEAVPHLRRAYDAGVRRDLAGYDLARALAATGDRGGALSVLERVRPARADDAESWFALGQLAQQLGDPQLAARHYREAARAAPQLAEPKEQLGLMLVMSGDYEAAIVELETATRIDPSDATARLNLAATYAQLGRVEDARMQAREALRLDPSYRKAASLLKALEK